jgi:hypothetical protein
MTANTPHDSDAVSPMAEPPLLWGTTSFEPGADVGLVSRNTVGLIERDNPSTRQRLWGLVSDDAPLDDVLDELSSTGLKALPDFGLAQVEGNAVRVVARGRARISAELSDGQTHVIDPSGVRTWIEEVIGDVVALSIELPPRDDDAAPLSTESFAVLAGSVPASSVSRRFDAEDPHAELAESGWTAGFEPAVAELGDDDVDSDLVLSESPPAPVSDADADADAGDGESWFDGDAPAQTIVPPQPPAPEEGGAGVPPPPPSADAQPPAPAASTPPPPDATVVVEPGQPLPPEADAGGAPAAPASAGVLLFSNDERIELDRAVLVGRNPKVAGAVEGPLPHIMKFDGPGQGLSRTHAEIRIEDDQVVLEDLHSTNGTDIELPDQPRQRLRGGEPVVIVPGTLIDFGEELTCTFESHD